MQRINLISSIWSWSEVATWLYKNKIIKDKELVEKALFFLILMAALEEQDKKIREIRHNLLERIAE